MSSRDAEPDTAGRLRRPSQWLERGSEPAPALTSWFRRRADRAHRGERWPIALSVLLACALSAPSLALGLLLDDHWHRQFVLDHLRHVPSPRAWWDMFDPIGRSNRNDASILIALGALPWWTSRSLVLAFLRPLATASHYLDYLLWPEQPWLMHLHNIAWYAAIVLLAGLLYRRVLEARAAALAAVLYAVDEAHITGAAWIASRNTLMTAAFIALTLLAWDHARTASDPRRTRVWTCLALLSLLAGHASSEGGTAAWPYLLGHALFYDRRGTMAARLRALLPLAAISCGWLALAHAGGFEMRGGFVYVDPRVNPLGFVRALLERYPVVLRAQLALPLQLEPILPAQLGSQAVGATSVMLLVLALVVAALARRQPALLFLALGSLGSAALVCTAGLEPRVLFVTGLGAHGVIACAIVACAREWRSAGLMRGVCAVLALCLLTMHIGLALAIAPTAARGPAAIDTSVREVMRSMPAGLAPNDPVFVLNSPLYFGGVLYVSTMATRPVIFLGTSSEPVELSRPSPNTLVLEPLGGFLREITSQSLRDPHEGFALGEQIASVAFRVTIDGITADRRPARVRFELANADDPHHVWVTWDPERGRFARASLPAPGGSLWLPGAARGEGPSVLPLRAAFR